MFRVCQELLTLEVISATSAGVFAQSPGFNHEVTTYPRQANHLLTCKHLVGHVLSRDRLESIFFLALRD